MPTGPITIAIAILVEDGIIRTEGSGSAVSPATEAAAVFGDDGVVADEEEGAGEDADDGDDEGREGGATGRVVVIDEGEGRRGREDDITPLRAVDAAEALRAVLGCFIGYPCLLLLVSIRRVHGHGRTRERREKGQRFLGVRVKD